VLILKLKNIKIFILIYIYFFKKQYFKNSTNTLILNSENTFFKTKRNTTAFTVLTLSPKKPEEIISKEIEEEVCKLVGAEITVELRYDE